jgi:hypothetical protein
LNKEFCVVQAKFTQGYRARMALLKLADQYTPQRLDAACAKAAKPPA